jgi:hypothetical protein
MDRRIAAAIVGGVTAVASAGTALALPSHPGTTSGAVKFVSVTTAQHTFHNGNFVGTDTDMSGGHKIGMDTIDCVPSSTGKTADCDVTGSFKQGQIYGTFTLTFKDGSLVGKVTGGTRSFDGATGTIKGQAVSDTKEKVSITYQTP